jgi:hypothetical protein
LKLILVAALCAKESDWIATKPRQDNESFINNFFMYCLLQLKLNESHFIV